MAYSIWDKKPDLVLPQIPFEFLAKLAEGQKQDLDKVDEKIGATKGLFAKMVAAPGHEPMAKRITDKYNQQLNDSYDKYSNNPLSREFSRELASISTSFANDAEVQKVIKSKEFYDKFGPVLWEHQNKRSIIESPAFDENGNFKVNEVEYNTGTFKVTPQADWATPIQKQQALKKEQRMYEQGEPKQGLAPDGITPVYTQTQIERFYQNPENMAAVNGSIFNTIMDNTNTDPGYIYLRKLAEQKYPDNLDAQKDFIVESIDNLATPFYYDWRKETTDTKNAPKGGGNDPKTVAKVGAVSTIGADSMTDKEGKVIASHEALAKEAVAYKETIDALSSVSSLEEISSVLVNPTPDENGNKVLMPNALITDENGFTLINTNLLTDNFEKQQAEHRNMELMYAQNKQMGAGQLQAAFAQRALNLVKDKNGNSIIYNPQEPLEDQLLLVADPKIKNKTYDKFLSEQGTTLNNTPSDKAWSLINSNWTNLSPEQRIAIIEGYKPVVNSDNTVNKKASYEKTLQAIETLKETGPVGIREGLDILLNGTPKPDGGRDGGWYKQRENILKEDKVYKTYAESVNKYLNTTIYTGGYNYSIPATEKNRMKDLLPLVVAQRDIQRSNFGPKAGNRSQTVTDDDKEEILKNILSTSKEKDYDNISIRFDEFKGKFVVDVVLDDDTYEIGGSKETEGGFDQETLSSIVLAQDPYLSSMYLQKANSLITQLDASNGRFAALSIPIQNDKGEVVSNNRVVVKSAIFTEGDIVQGDYLFTIPDIPGRVFVAKTQYALINMIDGYKEALQKNKGIDTLKDDILKLSTGYSVNSYPEKYKNIGGTYFPNDASKTSPVGK